jgi:hypothetical protein
VTLLSPSPVIEGPCNTGSTVIFSEPEDPERVKILPDPLLPEEDWSAVAEFTRDNNYDK